MKPLFLSIASIALALRVGNQSFIKMLPVLTIVHFFWNVCSFDILSQVK